MLKSLVKLMRRESRPNRNSQDRTGQTPRAKLALEALEARALMAGSLTATLSGSGVLSVEGTPAADFIHVRREKDISIDNITIGYNGGSVSSVSPALVNRIEVQALGGNDVVFVDRGVSAPTSVSGGDGNDTLISMSPGAALDGGAGTNQTVKSGPGTFSTFAVQRNGTLFELTQAGRIYQQPFGGTRQVILDPSDPNCLATSMALAGDGTLYELNRYGQIYQRAPGRGWELILNATDPNCRATRIAVAPNGTLYELNRYGQVYQRIPGRDWEPILVPSDPNCLATTMALAPDGTLYELNRLGQIYQRLPAGGWGAILDPSDPMCIATDMALAADGTLYEVNKYGQIYQRLPNQGWELLLDASDPNYRATRIAVAPDGTLYELNRYGQVYQRVPGRGWEVILDPTDPNCLALKMAVAPDGTLYEWNRYGQIYQRAPGRGWEPILDPSDANCLATNMAMAPDGTLYERNRYGQIYQRVPGRGWEVILNTSDPNCLARDLALAADGTLYEVNKYGQVYQRAPGKGWELILDASDSRYRASAIALGADGTLYEVNSLGEVYQRSPAGAWLRTSPDRNTMLALFRAVSQDGFFTYTERVALETVAGLPDHVRDLKNNVLYANPANAHYQGYTLGSLDLNGPGWKLDALVGKWFLGDDHPVAAAPYSLVSHPLFADGIGYGDVNQGAVGDCSLMSVLAEAAVRSPATIQNMFIDNGDGTFTVRFVGAGVVQFVTVDRYLPTLPNLRPRYARVEHSNLDGTVSREMWVALAEKAYAQLNESGGLGLGGNRDRLNSYAALDGLSPARTLKHVTGKESGDTYLNDAAKWSGAWNAGKLMVLGTTTPVSDSVVPTHAYAVVGYNPVTAQYTLYNPWGLEGGTTLDGIHRPGLLNFTWNQIRENFTSWASVAAVAPPGLALAPDLAREDGIGAPAVVSERARATEDDEPQADAIPEAPQGAPTHADAVTDIWWLAQVEPGPLNDSLASPGPRAATPGRRTHSASVPANSRIRRE